MPKLYHRYIGIENSTVHIGLDTIHSFRHPLGSWNISSMNKGYLLNNPKEKVNRLKELSQIQDIKHMNLLS